MAFPCLAAGRANAVWVGLFRVALVTCCLFAVVARGAEFENRTVSASKQFVVFCESKSLRSKIVLRAEAVRDRWTRILNVQSRSGRTIVINVIPKAKATNRTPKSSLRLSEAENRTVKVQLDVLETAVEGDLDLDREILRAILLEQTYRKVDSVAGLRYEMPPPWLVEGTVGVLRVQEQAPSPELFLRMVEKNDVPRLETFLKMNPGRMDATSLAVYRAQAMALLRAILDQERGTAELQAYIAALVDRPADLKVFLDSMPCLGGSPDRVRRLWILIIARYSAATRMTPGTTGETAKQLAKILSVTVPLDPSKPDGKRVSGSEALLFLGKDKRSRVYLVTIEAELAKLSLKAHPVWRPIVEGYRDIVFRLSKGDSRGAEKGLADLDALREQLKGRSSEIESYMDWFEASKMTTPSGAFTPIVEPELPLVPRNDPISRHMDDVEQRGW